MDNSKQLSVLSHTRPYIYIYIYMCTYVRAQKGEIALSFVVDYRIVVQRKNGEGGRERTLHGRSRHDVN